MKRITFFLVLCSFSAFAQPKTLTHAVITAKTTLNIPEDIASQGEEQGFMGMSNGDETKVVTWFKNDMLKIVNDGGRGRTTIIMDRKNKKTTTLIEMMGKRFGYYSTAEDEAAMTKRMDSINLKHGNKKTTVDIDYLPDTKKIAGYNCRKALIKTHHEIGKTDSMYVWYTPDIKMADTYTFRSGMSGFGGGRGSVNSGFENLNGFPMQYQVQMPRGMTFTIEVTKIDTDKNIEDKEFDIPKDFELKPVKDMQGGGPPFRM